MINRGEDTESVSDLEMKELLRAYLKNLKIFVKNHPNMQACYISYNDLMRDPELSIEEVNELFSGSLDIDGMRATIDQKLYRNRS